MIVRRIVVVLGVAALTGTAALAPTPAPSSLQSSAPAPSSPQSPAPARDFDGNVYPAVRIGTQVWLAENLRSTHYSDGTPLPHRVYGNDTTAVRRYGLLYDRPSASRDARLANPRFAASVSQPGRIQGACPAGWHLPSLAEWQQLLAFLGGAAVAGAPLKATGSALWRTPNAGASDASRFSALPAGVLAAPSEFRYRGERGYFLTTTGHAVVMLGHASAAAAVESWHPLDAVSCRCVKD